LARYPGDYPKAEKWLGSAESADLIGKIKKYEPSHVYCSGQLPL
jgi:hypothetical protein